MDSRTDDSSVPTSRFRGSRLRRNLARVTVAIAASLIAIGLSEVLLRIVAPMPWHEWAIWEAEGHITGRYMPNQRIRTAAGHLFRVNTHGFRGPDYSFEKSPGTLRIAVFGGSAALCYKSAGREKSWPGALESKLQERLGMPVEVINLALAGLSSFDSKINYLCFGRAFEPDAIIVYHTWNDMGRLRRLESTPYPPARSPRNRPLWMRIARATQLGRRARLVEFRLRGRQMDILSTDQEGTGKDLDRAVLPRAFAWERQNFTDFARWANDDGVLPILVTQACLAGPDNEHDADIRRHMTGGVSRGYTLSRAVDTWLKINEIIKDVARQHDAVFVDGYHAVPHDLQHVRDNVHLFDRGSDILAQEISDVLLSDPRFIRVTERVGAEGRSPGGDRGS